MDNFVAQAIAALITRELKGNNVVVYDQVQAIGVFPTAFTSEGKRPSGVMIRPTAGCHIGFDAVCNTEGMNSAYLAAATEYVFPLHPSVNTLFLLDAASGSNPAYVRWIIG